MAYLDKGEIVITLDGLKNLPDTLRNNFEKISTKTLAEQIQKEIMRGFDLGSAINCRCIS